MWYRWQPYFLWSSSSHVGINRPEMSSVFFLRWCQHYAKDEGHYVCKRRIATQQSDGTTLLKGRILLKAKVEKARSWLFSGYAGIPLEITLLSPFWGAKLHSFVMGSSWWAFPGHQVFARGVWLNGRRYGKTLQTPNRNPTYAPIGTVLLIFLCGLLAKSPKYRCGITCWGYDPIYFYDRWTIPKMQLH